MVPQPFWVGFSKVHQTLLTQSKKRDSEVAAASNSVPLSAVSPKTTSSEHVKTNHSCITSSFRLLIKDRLNNLKFLLDTESEVSVHSPTEANKRNGTSSDLTLFATNNTQIKTYGTSAIELDLGFSKNFDWDFVIADVNMPIIGADFLSHYHLAPYLAEHQLIDMRTKQSAACSPTTTRSYGLSRVNKSVNNEILAKYPLLFRKFNPVKTPKHSVTHRIEIIGRPVNCRARQLAPDKLRIAKTQFDELCKRIFQESPFASLST